jgi:basic membrane protein A and related proteins
MEPMPGSPVARASVLALAAVAIACSKKEATQGSAAGATKGRPIKVGLVTDIGGRGDQSFNDSALRGLELWAAGKKFAGSGYRDATAEEIKSSIPSELSSVQPPIERLAIEPLVLQSKAQEDYEPNLQLLVDQGVALAIGTGFMLENAVKTVAKRNPSSQFLLIDSPLLDTQGKPISAPNVRTVIFREEEGSFLVGALAGLVTKANRVAFVGGMEIPLIKKFEAGFRAGVSATNPDAASRILISYTGSFDNVAIGKQIAQDMLAKGADVVFHAAGSDGLGVIHAVKEARAAGKNAWVIGVDSDQWPVAPDAVLTSMIKRVDLAVFSTVWDLAHGSFQAGNAVLGVKNKGVSYAEVRVDFPGKAAALQRVEALRQKIVSGEIKVPSNIAELASFKVPP